MKNEREIEEFRRSFAFLKDKSVALYGTGQYTQQLLSELREFHFIGLIDQAKTGSTYCGLPVMSLPEIAGNACEAIVIVANLSTAPIIYRRIAHLEQKGIAVYYMNGRRPAEPLWKTAGPLWPGGAEQLLALAETYDVISFDLFDTLIMRKCLLPEEVFFIVSRRMGLDRSFPERRQKAEKTLYHAGNRFYDLSDIYSQLKEDPAVQQMELDVEQEMILPRGDMIRLYHHLQNMGRQVIITSDMYLGDEQLRPMLQKCGITEMTLFISEEQKASKHLGTLFPRLQSTFPGKRILHIGDNPRCDVENAEREGICALQIESAAAQMKRCGLDRLQTVVPNDAGRQMYELFAAKCFSSVFCQDESGKIPISEPEMLGYLFFGPLCVGYLAWLMDQVREQKIDHLLFVSRDGWLFYQLYQRLRQQCGGLPAASYFLTSRRCAGIASIKTEEDARFIFEDVCYNRDMKVGETLEKVYGIAGGLEPMAEYTLGELGAGKSWICIQRHMQRILEQAALERAGYQRYIDAQMIHCGNLGMMNFVGRGVTQRCLQNIFERELNGFYFALEYDAASILGEKASAFSWYSEPCSTHVGKSGLAEQMLLGEIIFSAPCGALVSFSNDGEPIYEQTKPERINLINACHQGIKTYVEDIQQIYGSMDGLADTAELADSIFGLLGNGPFILSRDIRAGLQAEDRFQ